MTPPTDDDNPLPAEEEADESAAPVVRDRPGGGHAGAEHKLDRAMRAARGVKVHMPHHRIEVDERAVRRAVRWGKADDVRSATLDEVMKQRRQVEKMVKASIAGRTAAQEEDPAAPAAPAPESGLSRQLMVWAIVFAVIIVGVMVVVAIKLL